MTPEELEKIVKANQLSLARIEIELSKVSRKLMWDRVAGIVKIILIFAPLILGFLYLSPMLQSAGLSWSSLTKGLQLYTGNMDALTGIEEVDQSNGGSSQSEINQGLLKNFCDPSLREVYVKNLCK